MMLALCELALGFFVAAVAAVCDKDRLRAPVLISLRSLGRSPSRRPMNFFTCYDCLGMEMEGFSASYFRLNGYFLDYYYFSILGSSISASIVSASLTAEEEKSILFVDFVAFDTLCLDILMTSLYNFFAREVSITIC